MVVLLYYSYHLNMLKSQLLNNVLELQRNNDSYPYEYLLLLCQNILKIHKKNQNFIDDMMIVLIFYKLLMLISNCVFILINYAKLISIILLKFQYNQ